MANNSETHVWSDGTNAIMFTRTFDAPRQLVFDAFTRPELLVQWFNGPPPWIFEIPEADLKPGGRLRYEWRNPETGVSLGLSGAYTEVSAPARLVHTELFDEDWTGGETEVTTTFEEVDGRTLFTGRVVYSSAEVRDGILNGPMADGMGESHDNLAKLLESLQAKD